jgi:hypothetical protein
MYPEWIKLSRFLGITAVIAGLVGWFAPFHIGHVSWLHVLMATLFVMPFLFPWSRLPIRMARILSILHLLPLLIVITFGIAIIRVILWDGISHPSETPLVIFLLIFVIIFIIGIGFHWLVVRRLIEIVQRNSTDNVGGNTIPKK